MTDKKRPITAHSSMEAAGYTQKDILGPNYEVGLKLRALYASIQEERIPDHLLDLLEKLDQAEQESSREQSGKSFG